MADFQALPPAHQGRWYRWLVAQEIFRRATIRGEPSPERLYCWQSEEHEVDFVLDGETFIEVKRGRSSPLDFGWFSRTFPGARLVVGGGHFETDHVRATGVEELLLDGPGSRAQRTDTTKLSISFPSRS